MNEDLDRLLRAAALAKTDAPAEVPFGFDTRVLAQWRAQADAASLGIARLLRRVAFTAVAIILLATAGSYLQSERNGDDEDAFTNEFAIADAAMQEETGL